MCPIVVNVDNLYLITALMARVHDRRTESWYTTYMYIKTGRFKI